MEAMAGRGTEEPSTADLKNHLKHSSGDLHSRLKTRKLLGVGETDDGDVHRSKLSQILGHSEQLYTRLPRGLRLWQFTTAFMFTSIGLWALFFPLNLFSFALLSGGDESAILPIRLYGAALVSFSMVFWCSTKSMDKDVIRWSLLGSTTYFIIQFVVTSMTLIQQGKMMELGVRVLSHRIVFAVISILYYFSMSDKMARLRKDASAPKDPNAGSKGPTKDASTATARTPTTSEVAKDKDI